MGTIEKGKAADLVFLDGDVFELGSRVRGVMILGEVVWEADDAN
jgi:imidazolonepropionase-like amidohydrolase